MKFALGSERLPRVAQQSSPVGRVAHDGHDELADRRVERRPRELEPGGACDVAHLKFGVRVVRELALQGLDCRPVDVDSHDRETSLED